MMEFARWEMRPELASIWKSCFDEPRRPVNFFFNNLFRPQNCLVYSINGKAAAMVHLLPVKIKTLHGTMQAHYIYAAATLPEYRGRGYMASMLAYASLSGARRGDRYSVVLPANPELYNLYGKSDYQHFYRICIVEKGSEQLEEIALSGLGGFLADFAPMLRTRNALLACGYGSVHWNIPAFGYAAGINRVYGGRLVCCRFQEEWSYALCRPLDQGRCEITELAASPVTLPGLLGAVLKEYPAKSYRIRMPENSKLFDGPAEYQDFGMIKPLGGAPVLYADKQIPPYLGLALD